ncbi:MAG: translocation/assembly module TamB [Paludibacteraceae bacterium]|nr:translocation/assembly module TamB [Paludibacteraceae bacterium]
MKKILSVIKKTLKAILWVVVIFVLIFLIVAAVIQIPAVQNKIVNYATTFVNDRTNTRVGIENVRISFPKSIVVEGVFLEDLQHDTLLFADKLKVNIVLKDLLFNKITVNSIELKTLTANLYNTSADSLFNYNFLLEAFSDTTNQTEIETALSSNWTFSLDKVLLKNIRIRYDDTFAGMNVKATLYKLELAMDELNIEKSLYRIDDILVEKLNASVQIKKTSESKDEMSDFELPRITARNIQINNSVVQYSDSQGNQSVMAVVNRFEIKKGDLDLEKERLDLDKIYLSESKIRYYANGTEVLVDSTKPDIETDKQALENNWKISVRELDFVDNYILYKSGQQINTKREFDANHLEYDFLNLNAANLYYSSELTELSVKSFSAIDRNGFEIVRFETDFMMDKHSISAKNIKAKTSASYIDGEVSIAYESLDALVDELPFMTLNVNIRKAGFSNADILYFSPALVTQDFFKNKKNTTRISGQLNGSVNNLKGKNIVLRTGINTVLQTNFHITGLPDAETANFYFPDLKINSGSQDIQMMAGTAIPENIAIPQDLNIQAVFKGKLKDFASNIDVNTSIGNGQLVATVDKDENFSANINLLDFDLGVLLKDNEMYGPVSLSAEAKGHGLDQKSLNAKIHGNVSKLFLNKYRYRNLTLDGVVANQQFDGKINLNDENAVFDFAGLVNFNPGHERVKFQLEVKGADLQKLQFSEKDIRIAFNASADLKGGTVNEVNGKVEVTNTIIAQNGKKYKLDSLLVASINLPRKSEINFSSALINLKYSGTISPAALPATLTHFIDHYFPVNDAKPLKTNNDSSDFKFEIELHNHPILSEVLLPQLNEFEPGLITGSFDSRKMELNLNANMKRIVYAGNEINDISLGVKSDSTNMNYSISLAELTNSQLKFNNFLFEGKLADNQLTANVSLSDLLNKKLSVRSLITKEADNYKLQLNPNEFYLMNNRWDIADDNYIMFGKQGFLVHHLFMKHATSVVNISSPNKKYNDDLQIDIHDFKLSDISRIFEKDSNMLKGNLHANVLLKNVNNSFGIIADADVNNLVVRNVDVGNLALKAENPSFERFDVDMSLSGKENRLTASGYFIPNGGENSMAINTNIQSLSMKTIEAFSMGQISESSGVLTGNINIAGKTNEPEVTGELVFDNVYTNPAFLNSRIGLGHERIQVTNDGIFFNTFTISDSFEQTAIVDGSIRMKQFRDFVFDLQLNSKDFLLFNTSVNDNDLFYGRMVVDSKINITGPMALPVVNANVKMKKGSNFSFVVPEEEFTTYKGENIVVFVDTANYNAILNRESTSSVRQSVLSGFDLFSVIEVDKDATLRLFMDPASSDSLVVRGDAALSLTMDRSGKMSLTGAYNLNEGSYLVSLESIVKRKFEIVPGSTIIWNGDPMDANIFIDASYTVRTAPYNLVADQMLGMTEPEKGSFKQQYPFLVLLKLRGAILKPEISFEVQLLPEDKGILDGSVNQKLILLNNDPSTLNKQVFALLVLGRFVQEDPLQSESVGTSALLRSTVGNFLSSQLNKLSSQFIPGIEMNFDIQSYDDYQTGEAQGRTQVEVGVKNQLFDERLSVQIGGTVDVEGERAKQNSASDIASDVTVEYKLTEDGRYRLKGFRHNQYEGALEGQLIETGAGVVYVRDFNKWKEFFKKPEKKKKAETQSAEDRKD